MHETTIVVPSADGIQLQTYVWAPAATARAVVQLQHGLGEHAARYRRFAQALTAAGYVVYAPDGRGSGRTAQGEYGTWGTDGWPGWVNDVVEVNKRVHADHPGVRVALFGHSMGSFASQQYLLDHSADVDAVVLCGTTEVGGIVEMLGSDAPADLTAFNAAFEQRTGFEWLSRDAEEVDKYVADPACGWTSEPFAGLETLRRATDPVALSAIRPDLPVLIIGGDRDPVAGAEALGPQVVAQRYEQAGLKDVQLILYPGARHELLNETNRDKVTADVLEFLDRTVG